MGNTLCHRNKKHLIFQKNKKGKRLLLKYYTDKLDRLDGEFITFDKHGNVGKQSLYKEGNLKGIRIDYKNGNNFTTFSSYPAFNEAIKKKRTIRRIYILP